MKNMLTLLKERQNRNHLLHRKSEVLFAFLFLMAMVIFGSFASPYFLTTRNLRNLLTLNIGMILLTFAQMYIILLGGVDLSVGSVVSMTSVICATMMVEGNIGNWLLVIILCLLASAAIGLVNGLLVTKGGLQPIIATLATQTVFAGVALVILAGPRRRYSQRIDQIPDPGRRLCRSHTVRPGVHRAGLDHSQPHSLRPGHLRGGRQ